MVVAAWSPDDIQRLLFSLNISVDRIRQWWPYEDNSCEKSSPKHRKIGISRACDHLATIFPAYSAAQIRRKMQWLWTNFGPDDGDHDPDALYMQGAWDKTLPRLEGEFPDIWNRVNQDVRDNSERLLARTQEPGLEGNDQQMEIPENDGPIKCRCGFSHVLGDTILCTNSDCSFWQHVVCYYGADDVTVAPDDHLCDQCQTHGNLEREHEMMQSAEELLAPDLSAPSNFNNNIDGRFTFESHPEQRLVAHPGSRNASTFTPHTEEPPNSSPGDRGQTKSGPGFQEPQISGEDVERDVPLQPPRAGCSQIHAISPLPNAHTSFRESLISFERQYATADIQWAPDSNEIQSHLKKISLQWFNISKSLIRDKFLLAEVPVMKYLTEQMHLSSRFAYPHKPSSEPPSQRETERWLRAMLGVCAVDWIFYPDQTMADPIASSPEALQALHFEITQSLASGSNKDFANTFLEAAVTRMLGDPESGLPRALDCAARIYSERFFDSISPFLAFGESRAPLRFASPNIGTMVEGESPWRISELTAVFSQLLRLKLQISLSHNKYELWFPEKSSIEDSYRLKGLLVLPNDDDTPRRIEYCLCPAILEHDTPNALERGTIDIS
ncbi:hypothetical protein PG997_013015 [Apiospora hydei]|uniref:Zinc finger PHD-type domain-containing protein n=1 Tax=Apiospora hydei TaxID=1337664 RepID=A0ABR1V4Z2_9PEZI